MVTGRILTMLKCIRIVAICNTEIINGLLRLYKTEKSYAKILSGVGQVAKRCFSNANRNHINVIGF